MGVKTDGPTQFTVGSAGYFSQLYTNVITRCNLQEEYKAALINHVAQRTQNDQFESNSEELTKNLLSNAKNNAELQLQASADFLLKNQSKKEVAELLQGPALQPWALCMASNSYVAEPSVKQTFKNVKTVLGLSVENKSTKKDMQEYAGNCLKGLVSARTNALRNRFSSTLKI